MPIESARVHVYAARWRIRFSRAKRANIHRLAPSPWSWCAPGGGGARGVRRQAVHPTVLRRSREPPPQRRVERSTGRHRVRAKCVSVSWAKCDRIWLCLCVFVLLMFSILVCCATVRAVSAVLSHGPRELSFCGFGILIFQHRPHPLRNGALSVLPRFTHRMSMRRWLLGPASTATR